MYRLVVRPEQIASQQISLDRQQWHYISKVLRFSNGDRFIALDGIGNAWQVEIADKAAKILKPLEIETELPFTLSLVTALPKGNGYEQILRCCTELGVSNFIPVISDRTIVKPKANKLDRWRKIVTEAAEQSERQIVPSVSAPLKFSDAIAPLQSCDRKYICVARGNIPTFYSARPQQVQGEIVIATGCEGGWTENEVQAAIDLGFKPVSLGRRILRAVTAPITACSIVAALEESK